MAADELPVIARLGLFGVGLVAAFGAAFGIGRAVGPIGDDDPAPSPHGTHTTQPGGSTTVPMVHGASGGD